MTTATVRYGYLAGAGELPYRFLDGLGGAELLRLNDSDSYGNLWWADEPDGWAAPSATTPMEGRSYGDGATAGNTTFEARTLTWTGDTVCPDPAARAAAAARLVAVLTRRGPVLYRQEETPPKALWLRATDRPKVTTYADGLGFSWTGSMIAEDPLKFAPEEAGVEVSTGLPGTPPGRRYPRAYPYTYGGNPAATGAVRVTNSGNEPAQARYRITGPAPQPTLVNVTTGQAAGWTLTLSATDELIMDTATELVTLNGTPLYTDRVPGSVFPRIVEGPNDVRWSVFSGSDPAARLYVSAPSTWR